MKTFKIEMIIFHIFAYSGMMFLFSYNQPVKIKHDINIFLSIICVFSITMVFVILKIYNRTK